MSWDCLTVGELKKALSGLPDDTQVVMDGIEDCEASEVYLRRLMPPALGQPGLIVIEPGQLITSEIDYHPRLDVWLDMPTSQHWESTSQEWKPR